MTTWQIFDLLLRGVAIGAQLGLCLALARSTGNGALRFATVLFIVSNICFTLNGIHGIRSLLGPAQILIWLLQIGGAGYFWLFAVTLFEDRRLSLASAAPPALLTLIGLFGQYGPKRFATGVWAGHNLIGLALALHALFVIIRSGRTDLVEARRRLRVPFLVIVAAFSGVLSMAQLGQQFGIDADWYELANAGLQALLGVGGVAVLLEARTHLFGAAADPPVPTAAGDAVTAAWLERLRLVMADDMPWRREGLTIAELATAVGLPEHRLRRLINDELGHRNFASFINQHRVTAAQAVLADPAEGTRSVASIAYDLGFGSLGPFNRAFRDTTGATPTEFRRLAMANLAPKPSNTG